MASAPKLSPIKPVHWNNTGVKVSNLHKGLLYLLRSESMIDSDLQIILKRLRPEISAKRFAGVTAEYVGIYQYKIKQQLPSDAPEDLKAHVRSIVVMNWPENRGNGDVDDGTAAGLNWLLEREGARFGVI